MRRQAQMVLVALLAVILMPGVASAQTLSLPDGTVTASTYYSGAGLNAYWAESVTTLTIDAENLSPGQYVKVSGKITGLSDPTTSWAEIGLIPKDRYDYWQTAFGGGWRPAVFDKGLYVVHWDSSGLALGLQEGWDDWTSTTYHNKNGGAQPYAWPLASPTGAVPWDFAFTMDPAPDPSESYLSVVGGTMYGTQPFPYGIDDGEPVPNDNDYTECYLIAQIWSTVANGSFSFTDVQAALISTEVWVAPPPTGDDGNPGTEAEPFATIQKGIDTVAEGGIVHVAAGAYQENLASWKDMEITKSLSLVGAGSGSTVVELSEGHGLGGKMNGVEIRGTDLDVTIEGITFTKRTGNTYATSYPIRIAETPSSFNNLILKDVEVAYAEAPNVLLGANGSYTNVHIEDCDFHHGGTWGFLGSGTISGMTVIDSDFEYNGQVDAGHGNGFDLTGTSSTNVTVSGGSFSNNKQAGINLMRISNSSFTGCVANNNGGSSGGGFGIKLDEWAGKSEHIVFCKCTANGNTLDGITIQPEKEDAIEDVLITNSVLSANGRNGLNLCYIYSGSNNPEMTNVRITWSSLFGNGNNGVEVWSWWVPMTITETFDATNNWWGNASGPSGVGSGTGDAVSDHIDYDPWLTTDQHQLAFGGARLVEMQQNDGGWDWPLYDGDPNDPSPLNTVGPIAMGLAKAYRATGDATMLAALQNAGGLLLSKTNNFSPSDGYLAAELDAILGGTTYVDHVTDNFYDPLAAGTYDKDGVDTDYDTAEYVQWIRDNRATQGIPNLAAWDLGMGLVAAASAGVTGGDLDDWIGGVKEEINELDGNEYYDVIGLAGAVYGLAFVGDFSFSPSAGEHSGAADLYALASILAGYQITESGGFAWNKDYVIPYDFNEVIQETAYAILALNEVGGYDAEVASAIAYMKSVQLCTGGWENYIGSTSGENNEVTGEALWGLWTGSHGELTLEPDADCYEDGETVTVEIWMRDVSELIRGGQFFLEYDETKLLLLDAVPSDVGEFVMQVYECSTVDSTHPDCTATAGLIDYAVGIDDLGGGSPTSGDAKMAILTFEALAQICTETDLITWRSHDPPSRLSGEFGGPVYPLAVEMDVVDDEAPTITCPSDVTIECDESTDPSHTGTPGHFQGFEDPGFTSNTDADWNDYNSSLSRVASGIGGILSKSGGFHAVIDSTSLPPSPDDFTGAFSRLGGYDSTFGGGFSVSLDVYMDLSDPAVTADTYGWDLSTAANNQSGDHLRDFIFHTASNASGNILVAGSNNTNFTRRNDLATINHHTITSTGWYTFQWVFRDAGDGSLAVDLNLLDASGASLWTETRNDPSDLIATIVGGHRYMWFTFLEVDTLAIDNTRVSNSTQATDNCDPAPTITYSDVPDLTGCNGTGTITRTWTATDACGNFAECVQVITVIDTEAPTFINCPDDINVDADAGGCDASVSFGGATATDNCGMDPTDPITYWIGATQITSPYTFPGGITTVTVEAKDACGNINDTCEFDVIVSAYNELVVDVELQWSFTGTRCVTFELWDCGLDTSQTVAQVLNFTNGLATGELVLVPCGVYDCITARDTLHTLRRTDEGFTISGTQYEADFTGDPGSGGDWLIGGNLNDDYWIDILDFGVFSWQWNVNYGTGNTTCATPYPHADISGDGVVGTGGDFSFISGNFLMSHELNCCGAPLFRGGEGGEGPITEISVAELIELGLDDLAIADLNQDGWLDAEDVAAFMAGVRPKVPQPASMEPDIDIEPSLTPERR